MDVELSPVELSPVDVELSPVDRIANWQWKFRSKASKCSQLKWQWKFSMEHIHNISEVTQKMHNAIQ